MEDVKLYGVLQNCGVVGGQIMITRLTCFFHHFASLLLQILQDIDHCTQQIRNSVLFWLRA